MTQAPTTHGATDINGTKIRNAAQVNGVGLNELFGRNRARLYKTALRLTGNHDDAEDALQDGLLAAFRNLDTFEGRSQFSTWLTRIVINAALMKRRQSRIGRTLSIDQCLEEGDQPLVGMFRDTRPNPEEIYMDQERVEIVERAIHAMPDRYRRALWLHHVEGLKTKQAAETLGLATGTVKSQLHRARLWLGEQTAEGRLHGEVPHTRPDRRN